MFAKFILLHEIYNFLDVIIVCYALLKLNSECICVHELKVVLFIMTFITLNIVIHQEQVCHIASGPF
jgi:hypothetical protein